MNYNLMVGFSWIFLSAVLIINTPAVESANVTHEDIRDAMLSLVHMFRTFEDKLERHEFREKNLGELFKKNFGNLDKKHRALEPLKGAISRLDERLSSVETILMQREEKDRQAQQKTNEILESIIRSLQTLTTGSPKSASDNPPNLMIEVGIAQKIDGLKDTLNTIKDDVTTVKDTFRKDALPAACLELAFPKHMAETEKLLTKYELKLSEYNVTGGAQTIQTDFVPLNEVSMSDEAWHSKMTDVMEKQEEEIKKIRKILNDAEGIWKGLPTRLDIGLITNLTLESVTNAQYSVLSTAETETNKVLKKLQEMNDRSLTTQEDVQKSLTEGNVMTERMYRDISKSYDQLKTEIQGLANIEKVMIKTGDSVMDTRKRVEYGVNQILAEVGELVKQQGAYLNRTITSSDIGATIVSNQTGALSNLSTKIEEEMSHVWRQIGIMYRQLTASKQALDKLQLQTEQYVNGSATTMDSMGSKVSLITTRMTEVDENLNYLLGRLSLVTQEFNQIKTGLGDALDKVKASFLAVQEKIKDKGPGPHDIKEKPSENDAV